MAVEIANLNGLSQAGAPVMRRGSTTIPTSEAMATTSMSRPTAVSGELALHKRSKSAAPPGFLRAGTAYGVECMSTSLRCCLCQHRLVLDVDLVNTCP